MKNNKFDSTKEKFKVIEGVLILDEFTPKEKVENPPKGKVLVFARKNADGKSYLVCKDSSGDETNYPVEENVEVKAAQVLPPAVKTEEAEAEKSKRVTNPVAKKDGKHVLSFPPVNESAEDASDIE